jgi:hypothetical protein
MPASAQRRTAPVRAPFDVDRESWRSRSAKPAPRAPETQARRPRRSAERRRRERHLRLLRRDLLIDFVCANVVTIVLLSVTAGLGVIALLEIPLGVIIIGSFIVERRRRRASASDRRRRRDASARRR